MRLLALFCALLTAPDVLSAQDDSVVLVQVVDPLGAPVSHALVQIVNGVRRVADADGRAEFRTRVSDSVRFAVRRLGYSPFIGPVARGDSAIYRVVLWPIAATADTIRVVATRDTPLARTGFYDRIERAQRGATVARFFTPEELDQRNPSKLTQVLAGENMVRLVSYNPPGNRIGRPGRVIVMGRSDCPMTILLDGQRVTGTLEEVVNARGGGRPGNEATLMSIDELVPAHSIAAIEVYGSMANAPVELQTMAGARGCGIVAIWTGARR